MGSNYSKGYLRYLLALFFLINVSSYMDRMVLAVLVEPIRAEMGLSDSQIGLLTGFAFAAFYAIMGFPIARLADNGNRKRIITISIVFWSAMTALSGKATNFVHLFLARMGVGVGEAGCFPTCNALIAELYPPKNRALAMGVFMTGSTVGVILGFVVGGFLAEAYGWRNTFFIVAAPGVFLALLIMFTMKQPLKQAIEDNTPKTPYLTLIKLLLSNPVYRLMVIGASFGTFATYGVAQWAPAFFIRSHGMSLSEVGTLFGAAYGGGSAIGMVLGGWVADKMQNRDASWITKVPAIAYFISFPLMLISFAVGNPTLAMSIIFIGAVFTGCVTGPTLAAIQHVIPSEGRATAAAILLFFTSMIGVGAAPFVVGLTSDLLSNQFGEESLRYALMIGSVVVLIASYCFFASAKYFKNPTQSVTE
ncbi:spinster family MFS transporter [Paraglaciecola chathamensis]|uniref:MFS transporter n=1 Tax=Paraglaciecola chathamensis TaxID=368405 RepID=A0A8H9IFA3_9ALTE|nr:MFS transporter [Paraglaciecola oceanifecundans]GGZ78754.1 MFS transporter [Paraglaciecola oceanifecundans]